MAQPRHEVSNNEIMAFNWKREAMVGQEMNPDKLKEVLKSLNYATSGNFINCISKGENPPIIRVKRGTYVFNPKPVHIERLKKVWVDYAIYGRNRLSHNPDQKQLKLDINRAIKMLKDMGYKVLKPITQYEEI